MSEKDPIVVWLEEPTPENFKTAADEYGMDELIEYQEKLNVLCSMAEEYGELEDSRENDRPETKVPSNVHNYWIDVDDEMNVVQDLGEIYSELVD